MSREIYISNHTNKDSLRVWLVGDLHLGHKKCSEKYFDACLDIAKANGDSVVIMGDLMETSIPTHMPRTMWEQIMTPRDQFHKLATTYGSKMNGVVEYIMDGNHEMRIYNKTSMSPAEEIARGVGATYLGVGGMVKFLVGSQEYNFVLYHGSGGSETPSYQLSKAQRIWGRVADVIALGHCHQLYADFEYVYDEQNGELVSKRIERIRTGGFLDRPDYAEVRFMKLGSIGVAVVTLSGITKNIDVELRDFTGVW